MANYRLTSLRALDAQHIYSPGFSIYKFSDSLDVGSNTERLGQIIAGPDRDDGHSGPR
jgi:hypothetical protein